MLLRFLRRLFRKRKPKPTVLIINGVRHVRGEHGNFN